MGSIVSVVLMYVALTELTAVELSAQIITEFYPTPSAGEPEWVELYNPQGRTLILDGWMLCDSRSCAEIPRISIDPYEYVVLTRDREALGEGHVISVPVVQMNLPSLNNTTDNVILRTSDSTAVDSLSYSMRSHSKLASVERSGSWYEGHVIYDTSFTSSLDANESTCGSVNSVVVLRRDVRIHRWFTNGYQLFVEIVNYGQTTIHDCLVHCRIGDVSAVTRLDDLQPGTSMVLECEIADVDRANASQPYELMVWHETSDDRSTNDTLSVHIWPPPLPGTLSIMEVLFDPYPTQGDYVELYNAGDIALNVTGWTIENSSYDVVVLPYLVIQPKEYIAVAMDSAVLDMVDKDSAGLRNRIIVVTKPINFKAEGDAFVCRTPSGFVVDSVRVTEDMHVGNLPDTKGVSLEKLDPALSGASPSSWTSSGSKHGGTPGALNSARLHHVPGRSISVAPTPCSSDPADYRYPCAIRFEQPFLHATIGVRILTIDGNHVAWLLNTRVLGPDVVLVWDGKDDDGHRALPGPYIVHVQCVDLQTPATASLKEVVVIGE